jgi:hypothetical protein
MKTESKKETAAMRCGLNTLGMVQIVNSLYIL